jgi:hypothetical protein
MSLINLTFLLVCFFDFSAVNTTECVGIPIEFSEFDKSVDRLNSLYTTNRIRSKEDYILSVRIYNTLTMNRMLEEKQQYKLFCDNFSKNLERTVKALNASLSKGMGYYSKKYKLFMGGHPDKNSMFCLR